MDTRCCCDGAITLLFACSGGSNVGQISNEVARKLTIENRGVMFCLAGLGGDVEPLLGSMSAELRIRRINHDSRNCLPGTDQCPFTRYGCMQAHNRDDNQNKATTVCRA